MNRWRAAIVAGMVATAVVLAGAWLGHRLRASAAAAWAPLAVSKETTILTEPLRSDGAVDYVAAINQKMGAGVTPENNAVVALLPAIGTGEKVLTCLGGEALAGKELAALGGQPAKGMFVDWDSGSDPSEHLINQYDSLQYTPWKPADSPEFDTWVNANEACLKIVVEAVKRPHFFLPMVSKDGTLSGVNIPMYLRPVNESGKALRRRAMRSAGRGDLTAAWEDLWAAHRLNHLVAMDWCAVPGFAAEQSEANTQKADLALLRCGVDRALAARMLADLRTLPPMPDQIELLRRETIYDYPAGVQLLSAGWKKRIEALTPAQRVILCATTGVTGLFFPDWERMSRYGVQFNEELYTQPPIHRATEWREWRHASEVKWKEMMAAAQRDMRKGDWNDSGMRNEQFYWPRAGETRDAYTDRLARFLLSITTPQMVDWTMDRKRLELTPLACALVLYRLENGEYPGTAEEAAKRYSLPMPAGFWGRPVDYTRTRNGFKLEVWGPGADSREEAKKSGLISIEINR